MRSKYIFLLITSIITIIVHLNIHTINGVDDEKTVTPDESIQESPDDSKLEEQPVFQNSADGYYIYKHLIESQFLRQSVANNYGELEEHDFFEYSYLDGDLIVFFTQEGKSLEITFGPSGINQLYTFNKMTYLLADGSKLSTEFTSDWIGPYIVAREIESFDIEDSEIPLDDADTAEKEMIFKNISVFDNDYERIYKVIKPDDPIYGYAMNQLTANDETILTIADYESIMARYNDYLTETKIAYTPVFTGGFHGTAGDATGEPTGQSLDVQVTYANGLVLQETKTSYAETLVIKTTNQIQAYNGYLPALTETITYTISMNKIDVSVEITAIDDIRIERYYGLQSQNKLWKDSVTYICGDNLDIHSILTSSQPELLKVEGMSLTDTITGSVTMQIDEVGLGSFQYLQEGLPTAFTRNYGKSYFNLVNGINLNLSKNESVYWSGSYNFE